MLTALGLVAALNTAHADEALDKRIEAAIVDTIKMTTAGEKDQWLEKYCDPKRCRDKASLEDMKAYQLESARKYSQACLVNDGVEVKQKKGDVATDPEGSLWYLKCTGRALGVPIRMRWDQEADRIWFVQLSF
ncbi:MAG: hypothetical protein H6734_18035 [Alphaproteobacteria bacterium]|nr:hypothetical protein [Alphaproteobacteria bacterium]